MLVFFTAAIGALIAFFWFSKDALFILEKRKKSGSTLGGKETESRQSVPLPQSNDSFYFHGSSKDGTHLFFRLGFRSENKVEEWIGIQLPNGLLLKTNIKQEVLISDNEIRSKDLQFICIEPSKRWIIKYDGIINSSDGDFHLKIELNWEAIMPSIFDFDGDLSAVPIARAISQENWSRNYFKELQSSHQKHYEQFGRMNGSIYINKEKYDIRVQGMRDRSFGLRDWGYMHRWLIFWGELEDGRCFQIARVESPIMSKLVIGYMWSKETGSKSVIDADPLNPVERSEATDPPRFYKIKMNVEGNGWIDVEAHVDKRFIFEMDHKSILHEQTATFYVGGVKGYGIVEYNYGPKYRPRSIQLIDDSIMSVRGDLVVDLNKSGAPKSVNLVGGKALGLIRLSEGGFTIPKGFCITSIAYKKYLEEIGGLEKLIEKLHSLHSAQEIEILSKEIENAILENSISESLHKEISKYYQSLGSDILVAVRSSATAEDMEGISFAGQYDSFLNRKGIDDIIIHVKRIWASLWSPRSISYRIQHAIPHQYVFMSVIVQEMIDSTSAGVMFTCNPVNQDTDSVVINSVPGIGEAVARGDVTPDTFTVSKKDQSIQKNVTHEEQSLKDSEILELVSTGIQIEKYFKGPQDIEFGIRGGKLYILQSRAVTTLQRDDEFSIHEFDSEINEGDYLVLYNVGEVLPGACSPLCLTTLLQYIDRGIGAGFNVPPMKRSFTPCYCGRAFMNITLFYECNSAIAGTTKDQVDMNLATGPIEAPGVVSSASKLTKIINAVNQFFIRKDSLKGQILRFKDYVVPTTKDPLELLQHIENFLLPQLDIATSYHLFTSSWAGIRVATLVEILGKSSKERRETISVLLQNIGEIVGNEINKEIQNIASLIQKNEKILREFSKESSKEKKLEILYQYEDTKKSLENFMKEYGHRGYKELELRSPRWEETPNEIITLIELMINNPVRPTSQKPIDVSVLSSYPFIARKLVLALLSPTRRSLTAREKTKNMLAKLTYLTRKAYLKLAQLLVEKSILPDQDLIFFFAKNEVMDLVKNPAKRAELLKSANRRRRIFPQLEMMEFPRVVLPNVTKPITAQYNKDENSTLQGDAACKGYVVGNARVVTTFSQIYELKAGEILIAPFTDVSWTPFFNLAAGIASDIGGMISHGAVVAREYGIPCVVDLKIATKVFKTGDRVILDAMKGTLSRVI